MAVSQLAQLLAMFSPQAQAAPLAAAPAGAAAAAAPGPSSPGEVPLPPTRPPGLGTNSPIQGVGTVTGNLPTPEAADKATPSLQGRVLARINGGNGGDSTGAGALKAVELSKGKSKWGAIATGLAAGMAAQEAAQKEMNKSAFEQQLKSWAMRENAAKNAWQREYQTRQIAQGDERNRYMGNYYNGLTANGGRAGSRLVTPEERAFRFSQAWRTEYANAQAAGLQGPALQAHMENWQRRFGIGENPGAAGGSDTGPTGMSVDGMSVPAGDQTPTGTADDMSQPGLMERMFGRGWTQPTATAPAATAPAPAQAQSAPQSTVRGMPPPNPPPSIARPASKADYDKLPSGTPYYDPDGNLRTKS